MKYERSAERYLTGMDIACRRQQRQPFLLDYLDKFVTLHQTLNLVRAQHIPTHLEHKTRRGGPSRIKSVPHDVPDIWGGERAAEQRTAGEIRVQKYENGSKHQPGNPLNRTSTNIWYLVVCLLWVTNAAELELSKPGQLVGLRDIHGYYCVDYMTSRFTFASSTGPTFDM